MSWENDCVVVWWCVERNMSFNDFHKGGFECFWSIDLWYWNLHGCMKEFHAWEIFIEASLTLSHPPSHIFHSFGCRVLPPSKRHKCQLWNTSLCCEWHISMGKFSPEKASERKVIMVNVNVTRPCEKGRREEEEKSFSRAFFSFTFPPELLHN